jgi:diguanylate cyclase
MMQPSILPFWSLWPRISAWVRGRGVVSTAPARIKALQRRSVRAEDDAQRFRLTLTNAPIGLTTVSLEGRFLMVNQALCAMLGYSEPELLAKTFQEITHPDDLEQDLAHVKALIAGLADAYRMEKRYFTKAGTIIHIQLDVSILRDSQGRPIHFISQIQDITQRRHNDALLHEAKELAQITLSSIGDGVIRTDRGGLITYCNVAALKLLDMREDQLLGRPFADAVEIFDECGERRADPVGLALMGHVAPRSPFNCVRTAGGALRPAADSVSPVRAASGEIVGAVFVFRDVSDAKAAQETLAFQAHHDHLTGLPNRLAFEEQLREVSADQARSNRSACLLYLDLDHFKLVNDTRGHIAGDKLLGEIGAILRTRVREHDFLARIGGDEFAVITRDTAAAGAKRLAQDLIEAVQDYSFIYGDRAFKVGLSIGISLIEGAGADPSAILAHADTACYAAKDLGRGRYHVYEAENPEICKAETKLDWAQRIQSAFADKRFELYLQQICRVDGTRLGFEALVRIKEPGNRLFEPGAFMSAVRRMGWVTRIDQWVIREVVRLLQSAELFADDLQLPYVSVNLSAMSVGDKLFGKWLLHLLDTQKVAPERLRFEIVETEQLEAADTEVGLVAELRKRGYEVWLDDFGVGYNSFELLKRMTVDGVKIDGSFVRDVLRDPVDRALVEGIVSIGKSLGLGIVAEGVEDRATLRRLTEMGIATVQGHLFHRAEPAERLVA